MTDVSFETQALEVSKQYDLALDNVKDAYAAKPDKLSTMFNQMTDARHKRNLWSVATLVTSPLVLTFSPAAALPAVTGYLTYKNQSALNWVGSEVRSDVAKAPPAPPPSAP